MCDSDILGLLLRCTRQGLLTWTRDAPDVYLSKRDSLAMRIEFQRPLLADETTSGADIVQVTCGALCLTYTSGTTGMEQVREILTSGRREWSEHSALIDSRMNEITHTLERWLQDS